MSIVSNGPGVSTYIVSAFAASVGLYSRSYKNVKILSTFKRLFSPIQSCGTTIFGGVFTVASFVAKRISPR